MRPSWGQKTNRSKIIGAFQILSKKEISLPDKIDFDSVFLLMKSNVIVNTEKYDLNYVLDSDTPNICCHPKTQKERFALLYLFFVNGIILTEDTFAGTLHYAPF